MIRYAEVGGMIFFFFQAEDGIRDLTVTGVQTCALPILLRRPVNVVFEVEGDGRDEQPATREAAVAEAPELCAVTACSQNQERARLNPMLTFDNFVTGKANQLARAAAMQVTENPG